MTHKQLKELLAQVREGKCSVEEAASTLKNGPFRVTDLGFANLDHHRRLRHGLSEVIFGQSKSAQQIITICHKFLEEDLNHLFPILITRLDEHKREALMQEFPKLARENSVSGTVILRCPPVRNRQGSESFVAILAAGTSDLPVAEEVCDVCLAREVPFEKMFDVGVSGIHRLLSRMEELNGAGVFVVVAGMEGALPSVVAGLVGDRPLIAVPTSIGYGASFNGLAALLAMLNSCAPGVTVVNIDNGFSAGFAACNILASKQ